MVVAGHNWTAPEGPGLWNDLQEDYAAAGIPGQPPSPPESVGPWRFPEHALTHFEPVDSRRYHQVVSFRPDDYVRNLSTQSTIRALAPEVRARFLGAAMEKAERWACPTIDVTFVVTLAVARKP